jgi:hypothetical protein
VKKRTKIALIIILVLAAIFLIFQFQVKNNRVITYEHYTTEYTRMVTSIVNETKGLSIEEALLAIISTKNLENMKELKKLIDKCKIEFNSDSQNKIFYHNSIKKQYDELNMLFGGSSDLEELENILTGLRIKVFYNEKQ